MVLESPESLWMNWDVFMAPCLGRDPEFLAPCSVGEEHRFHRSVLLVVGLWLCCLLASSVAQCFQTIAVAWLQSCNLLNLPSKEISLVFNLTSKFVRAKHVCIRPYINCMWILGRYYLCVNYVISVGIDIWYDINYMLNMLSAHQWSSINRWIDSTNMSWIFPFVSFYIGV